MLACGGAENCSAKILLFSIAERAEKHAILRVPATGGVVYNTLIQNKMKKFSLNHLYENKLSDYKMNLIKGGEGEGGGTSGQSSNTEAEVCKRKCACFGSGDRKCLKKY